jgi:hypothetical protein
MKMILVLKELRAQGRRMVIQEHQTLSLILIQNQFARLAARVTMLMLGTSRAKLCLSLKIHQGMMMYF